MPKPPILEHCLSTLRGLEANLQARGVLHAAIFGSVARGEDNEKSDIDIIVTIESGRGFGISGLINLEDELTEKFGRKVEVFSAGGLKPKHDRIRKDMVQAF
ncbi:MAG TPA: nucleotidyltransferase domain-containing protein [Candidatus Baltobacteraceae bacterium]|nr:nucleotidyltransferase domain-containing protein [Candidatus Baltobacteraceae bacterium]